MRANAQRVGLPEYCIGCYVQLVAVADVAARRFLYLLPLAAVERWRLRTDIRHDERRAHRVAAVRPISSGAHVTPIITTAAVVAGVSAGHGRAGVLVELHRGLPSSAPKV